MKSFLNQLKHIPIFYCFLVFNLQAALGGTFLNLFASDPCLKNQTESNLRKRNEFALSQFNRAIDEHNLSATESESLAHLRLEDLGSETKLIQVFSKMLLNLVQKNGETLPKFMQRLPLYVRNALEKGILPVPVSSNWEMESLFNFSGITHSLKLGLLPVSWELNPSRPIALGNEHPMHPELVSSTSTLFYHDFTHVDLMSEIYHTLHLDEVEACQAFTQCIQSIPGLAETPSLRIGVSYALHEDLSLIGTLHRPYSPIYDYAFLDFVFELTLNSKAFSVQTMITGENSIQSCSALLNGAYDENLSYLKRLLPSEVQTSGTYEGLYLNDISVHSIAPKFLIKLQNACRAFYGSGIPTEQLGPLDLGIDRDKFQERFRAKYREIHSAIMFLKSHFEDESNAACKKMLKR